VLIKRPSQAASWARHFPTLEYAHQHLLTPDAAVIPAGGSVMGYLAGGDTLKGMLFGDRIEISSDPSTISRRCAASYARRRAA